MLGRIVSLDRYEPFADRSVYSECVQVFGSLHHCRALKYSVLVGVALFFVYIGATFGVKYTTLSNAGFLCALTVVFTPIINWLVFKKTPDRKLSLVVMVCFIGIALMTLGDDFSINMVN